ncbi:ThuA domain-containing protein [Chitinophaga sp.]|uniref:ThuA domain-containing protein n=1 Tax=Chitinophaga sp. TaxID=1869181 RepID=UPI0031CDD553
MIALYFVYMKFRAISYLLSGLLLCCCYSYAQQPAFRVIAFFTAAEDAAHISFVREANQWFPEMGARYHFTYDTTSNWQNLNHHFLSRYQVVLFLDTRPEKPTQRKAFQHYMENGGAWIGFHFAAFALTPSAVPQNWNWYHHTFLGSGSYVSNTWRPTTAVLRVENRRHPVTRGLPAQFQAAPNEWYRWSGHLRQNKDITVLASIDSSSFPLGTGPKASEIWHSGDYPVVWTNRKYRMVYFNMGHNDMDYEHGTQQTLSHTFGSPSQNLMILQALWWLGTRRDTLIALRGR